MVGKSKTYKLSKQVGVILRKKKLHIVVAESCTGGLLSASITDVPGSSLYFEKGFVVYSNVAKKESLGVKEQTLRKFGAVSEETAKEMALGALKRSHAEISVAITGIAGPAGGTKRKPVGMVCFAFVFAISGKRRVETITAYFKGNRQGIREQAIEFALQRVAVL